MLGAHMEDQGLLLQTDVDAVRMRDVMLTQFSMLSASDTLEDALQRSVHTLQDVFPVVRGANLVGAVSRQGIVEALRRRQRLRPGRDDPLLPDRPARRLPRQDAAPHHGRAGRADGARPRRRPHRRHHHAAESRPLHGPAQPAPQDAAAGINVCRHETSQDKPLAPGLYLVATPIGNLEDITLRALRVLRSVDRIACEDTRQTQKLLNHFDIRTPTVSYHMHNEGPRTEELTAELKQGARIAVVSDAGTPGIADPGGQIAAAAIAAGIAVFPVPGANAAISALIASGLPTDRSPSTAFSPQRQASARPRSKSLPRRRNPYLL